MEALIVTDSAQIREALSRQFSGRSRAYSCIDSELLASSQAMTNAIGHYSNAVVINAICFQNLDDQQAESLIEGSIQLAQICDSKRLPLFQVSSSRVFDGVNDGPHREGDPVVPASKNGVMQSRLEELVRGVTNRHIILRTSTLFGEHSDNVLVDMLLALQQGGEIILSDRCLSAPTYVGDFARVVSGIIDQISCDAQSWGTYHYCSSDPVSHYQFGETVLAVASQYLDIAKLKLKLVPTEVDATQWYRPLLNCEKILNTFGIKQLPWRAFITSSVKQFFEHEIQP